MRAEGHKGNSLLEVKLGHRRSIDSSHKIDSLGIDASSSNDHLP